MELYAIGAMLRLAPYDSGFDEGSYVPRWLFQQIPTSSRWWDSEFPPPQVYKSQSRQLYLSVVPNRDNRGGTSYVLKKTGETLWSKDLPYVLSDCVLTDRGITIGCVYTRGRFGLEGVGKDNEDDRGEMVLVFISAEGKVLDQESIPRRQRALHMHALPCLRGFILDELGDRVVLQVEDQNYRETWWVYQLSTARRVENVDPRTKMRGRVPEMLQLQDARLVPDTPLILTKWRYDLFDAEWNPMWDYLMPHDYEAFDKMPRSAWLSESLGYGALLPCTPASKQFEISSASTFERILFSVNRNATNGWNVQEISRTTPPSSVVP
jgi:hypothetical protein